MVRKGERERGREVGGERERRSITLIYCFIGAVGYQGGHFASGSGNIFLDDVKCSGTESSLLDCTHSPMGSYDCGHYEDAGVTCLGISVSFEAEVLLLCIIFYFLLSSSESSCYWYYSKKRSNYRKPF